MKNSRPSIVSDGGVQGFIRITDVLRLIPIGRSTWWYWVSIRKAPQPIKLGPRTTAWRVEDIQDFIEELEKQGAEK